MSHIAASLAAAAFGTGDFLGGGLDGTAGFRLMIAFATGGQAEVSAVASLYPVVTVLLAVAVLWERPSFTQTVGLVWSIPAIFILRSS